MWVRVHFIVEGQTEEQFVYTDAFAKPQRYSRNIALEHHWCIF